MAVKIEYSTLLNTSRSGARQGCATGPSRALFTLDYNNSRQDELRPLFTFLNRLQGGLKTFDVVLPYISHGQGLAGTGSGLVQTTTNTGYAVPTKGWPASTLIRRAGDVIQFSGSPRIYLLADDLTSDASGNAVAALCSPLVQPVVANETVNIKDIKIRARVPSSLVALNMAAGNLRAMKSITIEEEIHA